MVLELRAIVVNFFTSDGKFSFVKVGAQLVVLSALVLGLVAFVGNNKTVTLNVDGKVSSVQTFGGTVGEVVKSAKVELQAADRVSPSADARVENGSVINVNLAKAVKISLDGAEKTINTTSANVEGLVTELGVASASEVSVPKDAQLAVSGSFVSISTPKTVSILADGKASKTTTTAATVADVLKDAGITVGAGDRLSQPRNAHVVNDMAIKVSRVDSSKTAATTEEVPFETLSSESAELFVGEKKVTQAGVPGKVDKNFKLVLVDGREASRTLVSETVSVQPVTEKVTVGTKEKPEGRSRRREHRSSSPRHDERSHVGQDRAVRIHRQLVHQLRQRLLRRAAVRHPDLDRCRRRRVRTQRQPRHQGAADRYRQPRLRTARPPALGLRLGSDQLSSAGTRPATATARRNNPPRQLTTATGEPKAGSGSTLFLVERQSQRLAVERLLEQRAGEPCVAVVLARVEPGEDAAQHLVRTRLQRVLVLGQHLVEDRLECVDGVVGERDLAGEPGAQSGVREQEGLHQPRVPGHDHDQAVAVVLHPLEQDLDRLGAEVHPAVLRGQRVGLVDEQDAVQRTPDHPVRLDGGRADVLPYQANTDPAFAVPGDALHRRGRRRPTG